MASTQMRKKLNPGRGGVLSHSLSDEEAQVRAIAEIVNSTVELSRSGEMVDLNALKFAPCRKYGLSHAPKLVEMISGLPDSDHGHHHKPQNKPPPPPSPFAPPPASLLSPSIQA
ncbi:hypothetical protein MRB53_008253 [Persea americana]|uniref:Uncharacterized protein n=1 Tax=Persea americana TaxID=3435 RepID=A0ACC2MM78_PERAE|nr:hypothetical protein MRB53_008253 [Persea americana]